MSDEDRDVDIESDDDLEGDEKRSSPQFQSQRFSELQAEKEEKADKRAHHNALERKRRDHIKDSFSGLRDAIPQLQGEKVASRAQILKKAADYIQAMRRKNLSHQQDIDDLKKQNQALETQSKKLRTMQKSKGTGEYVADNNMLESFHIMNSRSDSNSAFDGGSGTETSDSETPQQRSRIKRLKGNPVSSTSNT